MIKKITTNFTQEAIAKKLGITQPTVSNWLNLKVRPQGLQRAALKEHFPRLFKTIERIWKEKEKDE